MRTLAALLLSALPALAQPFPGPSPVDATTGRGAVDAAWVRQSMHWVQKDYDALANRVAWYWVHYDEAGGEITVTPAGGGRPQIHEASTRAVRRTAIQLSAVTSANGVVFTGYSGSPIITGSIPKVGDPYTGFILGGGSAVWSKPIAREKSSPPDGVVGVLVP